MQKNSYVVIAFTPDKGATFNGLPLLCAAVESDPLNPEQYRYAAEAGGVVEGDPMILAYLPLYRGDLPGIEAGAGMSDTFLRFVTLDRRKVFENQFREEHGNASDALAAEMAGKADDYLGDDEGIVYKPTKPNGRFIYYRDSEIVRTRRPGETRGTLSIKEAREAGYDVN